MKLKSLVCTAILLLATGCEKEPAWKRHTFRNQDMRRSSTEARLPAGLWEKISAVAETAKAPGPAPTASETKGPLPSVFAPLKVYLVEKNRGILQGGHVELEFGAGGGELDLKDYVQPLNGSFYLAIEFKPELEKVDRRVFYLSDARARKVDGETYGAGCQQYFEISKTFAQAMKGEGFLVNTSGARHVSALVGTYFFAVMHEGKLYLASLTIKDTTANRKLLCGL